MGTMTYKPAFDTTVRTTTVIERHNTMHTKAVDWNEYPFDDPSHTAGLCCNKEGKLRAVEKWKEYLRICEWFENKNVVASNYVGWPRIWDRVIGVGMASAWPYWKPRPTVLLQGALGVEWVDWTSLTGAEIRDTKEPTR